MSPYDPTVSDEANVTRLMRDLNVSASRARFILAIEKGEIDGDLIELNPVTLRPLKPTLADGRTAAAREKARTIVRADASDDENIAALLRDLDISDAEARFILVLEKREQAYRGRPSCLIEIGEDGTERPVLRESWESSRE